MKQMQTPKAGPSESDTLINKDEEIGRPVREEAAREKRRLEGGGNTNNRDKTKQDNFKTGMGRAFGNAIHKIKGETGNPNDERDVIKDLKNLGKTVASPPKALAAAPEHILKRKALNAKKEIANLDRRLKVAKERGDAETADWAEKRIAEEGAKKQSALKELARFDIKEKPIVKKPRTANPLEGQLSIEKDLRYKQLIEEMSLQHLKSEDPSWFYKNYSGKLSPDGYLLDPGGKKTNFLPSQNILDITNIKTRAGAEFIRRYHKDTHGNNKGRNAIIVAKENADNPEPFLGRKIDKINRELDSLSARKEAALARGDMETADWAEKRIVAEKNKLKQFRKKPFAIKDRRDTSSKDGGLKWIEVEEVDVTKANKEATSNDDFSSVQTFDELRATLEKMGAVEGPDHLIKISNKNNLHPAEEKIRAYSPEELWVMISALRAGMGYADIENLPPQLRGKVAELLGGGSGTGNSGIDKTTEMPGDALAPEAQELVESLPPQEKKTFLEGLANAGYFVQETKSAFFKNLFSFAAKGTAEGGMLNRFFSSYARIYENEGAGAREARATVGKSAIGKVSGVGTGVGTIVKYGRIILDAAGGSIVGMNPLRNVMAAAMFFGRGSEALKEARLSYEEIKEKTRVINIDQAADEAWAIYELAKNHGGNITKESLEKAYRERLPADIRDRLSRMDFAGYGVMQSLAHKHVLWTVGRIERGLQQIEERDVPAGEKAGLREQALGKYRVFLSDMDRIVGNAGALDMFSYGARLAEGVGKGVANVMVIETLAEGVFKIFESADQLEKGLAPVGIVAETAPNKISDGEEKGGGMEADKQVEKLGERNLNRPELPGNNILRDSSGNAVLDSSGNPVRTGQSEFVPAEITASTAPAPTTYKVETGDNLWNVLKENLPEVKELEGGKQSNAIANIIERIKENPESFGIKSGDVDKLTEGDEISVEKVREVLDSAKISINGEESGIIERAENLSEEQVAKIDADDEKIAEWAAEHPGEALTSDKVSEILSERETSTGTEAALSARIDNALKNKLNDLYGWKGFFGFGARSGLESSEWISVKDESVERIIDFPLTALEEYKHIGGMRKYLEELSEQSNLKPDAGEKVDTFIARALRKTIY